MSLHSSQFLNVLFGIFSRAKSFDVKTQFSALFQHSHSSKLTSFVSLQDFNRIFSITESLDITKMFPILYQYFHYAKLNSNAHDLSYFLILALYNEEMLWRLKFSIMYNAQSISIEIRNRTFFVVRNTLAAKDNYCSSEARMSAELFTSLAATVLSYSNGEIYLGHTFAISSQIVVEIFSQSCILRCLKQYFHQLFYRSANLRF